LLRAKQNPIPLRKAAFVPNKPRSEETRFSLGHSRPLSSDQNLVSPENVSSEANRLFFGRTRFCPAKRMFVFQKQNFVRRKQDFFWPKEVLSIADEILSEKNEVVLKRKKHFLR
jgi:hypothetical protein